MDLEEAQKAITKSKDNSKTRNVFRTQSNLYNGPFSQKNSIVNFGRCSKYVSANTRSIS